MNKAVTAEVLLTNEGQFDFAEISNEVHDAPSKVEVERNFFISHNLHTIKLRLNILELELYRKKKIEVKANSGSSTSFMIIPRELGYITIKATANSVLAGDSVEHKLLVKVTYFVLPFYPFVFVAKLRSNFFFLSG